MKKSLLTVITFAIVVANLVLTILLTLNTQSEIKAANELITKVCEAIELDIASSDSNESTVPVDQTTSYDAVDSENKLTINLKMDEDGVAHFAVLTCTLTENMQSKAFETYGNTIGDYGSRIQSIIQSTISSYTYNEILSDQQAVKDEIKDKVNALFGASDFIISVDFPSINFQ